MGMGRDIITLSEARKIDTIWYNLHVKSKTGHKYVYKTDSDTENRLVKKDGVWGGEGLGV